MVSSSLEDKVPIRSAAPLLGVSPHTLRAWIRNRRFPFFRCGRRIVCSRQDIEQYLAAHRVLPENCAV